MFHSPLTSRIGTRRRSLLVTAIVAIPFIALGCQRDSHGAPAEHAPSAATSAPDVAAPPAVDTSCASDLDCTATGIRIDPDGRCSATGIRGHIVSRAYVRDLEKYCAVAGYSASYEAVTELPRVRCVASKCVKG